MMLYSCTVPMATVGVKGLSLLC